MKYDLVVCYAGQEAVFKNLEHGDENLVDENYLPRQAQCVEENDERIWEDVSGDFTYEVKRHAST